MKKAYQFVRPRPRIKKNVYERKNFRPTCNTHDYEKILFTVGKETIQSIVKIVKVYLVVCDDPVLYSLVHHLFIPVLKSLGLRDLLIGWVTVEDVIIPFPRRTCPDVCVGVSQLFAVVQVVDEDLVVHCSSEGLRLEVVHAVQV